MSRTNRVCVFEGPVHVVGRRAIDFRQSLVTYFETASQVTYLPITQGQSLSSLAAFISSKSLSLCVTFPSPLS
jgi:hypothetical protein